MGHGTRLRERKDCKQCRMYTVMPQSFQSFNIICIETILSSGDEQHEVLCSTVAAVGHGTRLCAVCSAKPAKNVGCIGDATIFSILFQLVCIETVLSSGAKQHELNNS